MTLISPKLERVPLEDTQIKLEITQKTLNQIKWLCREIPKVEWSGVLFYSIEGSIKDPENMQITIEDILPMQKGTATFTSYELDENVVEFMMDNETMEKGWKMGHIHSHNTMAVYFSGTDWSELEDNAPNHNIYLSLIVNNFMDFCAKVAFIAESDKAQFTAKDEQGNRYNYSVEETSSKKLVTYDCAISSPQNKIEVSEDFGNRVKEIIKDAEKVVTKPFNKLSGYPTNTNPNSRVSVSKVGKGRSRISVNLGKSSPGWSDSAWDDDFFDIQKTATNKDIREEEDDAEYKMYEDFAMYVINTGNNTDEFKDIEEILDYYMAYNLSPSALRSQVISKYNNLYANYFFHTTEKNSAKMFFEVTENLIEVLNSEVYNTKSKYVEQMLTPVIDGLESILDKFQKYESDSV